jgi:hypothetical protein
MPIFSASIASWRCMAAICSGLGIMGIWPWGPPWGPPCGGACIAPKVMGFVGYAVGKEDAGFCAAFPGVRLRDKGVAICQVDVGCGIPFASRLRQSLITGSCDPSVHVSQNTPAAAGLCPCPGGEAWRPNGPLRNLQRRVINPGRDIFGAVGGLSAGLNCRRVSATAHCSIAAPPRIATRRLQIMKPVQDHNFTCTAGKLDSFIIESDGLTTRVCATMRGAMPIPGTCLIAAASEPLDFDI